MTATAKQTAEVVREIPVDQLFVSLEEVRKTIDPKALEDLAASIKQQGVIEALLVRPRSDAPWSIITDGARRDGPGFEIVAGQRRWLATKIAGKTSCPCVAREMSDADAAERRIISNLQRANMPALEEAQAIGRLLETLGSIPAVAARLGKEQAYIAKRLKLLTLTLCSCDALREGLITIEHALLLARLGTDEQDAALKWTLDPQAGVKTTVDQVVDVRVDLRKKEADEDFQWRVWEPESPQRLKEHIEHTSGRKLSSAPWYLDDTALLPDAGACSACPSNTKANAALFSDLAIEEATCADGGCFEAKRAEFVSHVIRGIAAQDEQLPLRLSWKYSAVKPRWRKDVSSPIVDQVFRAGQWVEAKHGSCGHMCSGVTVDWGDSGRLPGELLMVCVDEKCPVHPKAWEQKSKQGAASGKRNEAEEKAAAEKRKAEAIAESKLRIAVASKAIERCARWRYGRCRIGLPTASLLKLSCLDY
jgi:ParB/RepB/Spo0J family partition protein